MSLLRDKYVSKIKDESIAKMQQQNEREIDKIYSTQRARIERAAHYKAKQIKRELFVSAMLLNMLLLYLHLLWAFLMLHTIIAIWRALIL